MSRSEYNITRDIMKATSRSGSRVFRNNTGMGWVGKVRRIDSKTVIIKNAQPLHAGLTNGSSDLIGWTPVKITPDHVGSTVGLFTAIEVKAKSGKASKDQLKFIKAVRAAGGIAGLARSDKQALELINHFQKNIL